MCVGLRKSRCRQKTLYPCCTCLQVQDEIQRPRERERERERWRERGSERERERGGEIFV